MHRLFSILCSLLVFASISAAADKVVLFDGADLSAWLGKGDKPAEWKIVDGAMEVNGTGDIHTKQTFGDYTLHVEFRTPQPQEGQKGQNRGNSGVFLGDLYEIQVLESFGLKSSMGDCASIYNQKPPDENAAKPPLEWQSYDITYRAPRFDAEEKKTENARVTVIWNGKKVHDNVEILKGTSGKSAPEKPGPASVRLQDHHHPVQYRNIYLVPADEASAEAIELFNGKDLTGWKQAGPGSFEVKDGELHTVGGMGLLWYTPKQFGDFVLSLEYKNSRPQDNSGVFARFSDPANDPWKPVKETEEVQIQDSAGLKGTGSLYKAHEATEAAAKPTGEWNAMEITLVGKKYTVKVNGKLVNEFESAKIPLQGYIGLQNHDPKSKISFRNVKIVEIKTADAATPTAK